jgi:hypothetical protein
MGFWGTALLPANGMIGSGIFALPAIMFAAVGNFAPWTMLLGALLILPLVYVFAALSTRFELNVVRRSTSTLHSDHSSAFNQVGRALLRALSPLRRIPM